MHGSELRSIVSEVKESDAEHHHAVRCERADPDESVCQSLESEESRVIIALPNLFDETLDDRGVRR